MPVFRALFNGKAALRRVLSYFLFSGGKKAPCLDACDAVTDTVVILADGIYMLLSEAERSSRSTIGSAGDGKRRSGGHAEPKQGVVLS